MVKYVLKKVNGVKHFKTEGVYWDERAKGKKRERDTTTVVHN
jgi:hypothetical protein